MLSFKLKRILDIHGSRTAKSLSQFEQGKLSHFVIVAFKKKLQF
jgi:hypothetical protein